MQASPTASSAISGLAVHLIDVQHKCHYGFSEGQLSPVLGPLLAPAMEEVVAASTVAITTLPPGCSYQERITLACGSMAI